MFRIIERMFIVLLTDIVNASNHIKCVSWSTQKWRIQPTLISLHPNEHSQELHYYPFAVKLDEFIESCNTLNDLPNKVCVPNKKICIWNSATCSFKNGKYLASIIDDFI